MLYISVIYSYSSRLSICPFPGSISCPSTTTPSSMSPSVGSNESPVFMINTDLHSDAHSSEEELEVINGPANNAKKRCCRSGNRDSFDEGCNGNYAAIGDNDSIVNIRGGNHIDAIARGIADCGDHDVVLESPQSSCSPTLIVENRKRPLAQSAEYDVSWFRNLCNLPCCLIRSVKCYMLLTVT